MQGFGFIVRIWDSCASFSMLARGGKALPNLKAGSSNCQGATVLNPQNLSPKIFNSPMVCVPNLGFKTKTSLTLAASGSRIGSSSLADVVESSCTQS